MKLIKFSDIEDQLQTALEEKLKISPIPNENGFSLIAGFMTLPIQKEISNNIILEEPSVPAIGIVGNTSGRIYTFALKAVLPEIEI